MIWRDSTLLSHFFRILKARCLRVQQMHENYWHVQCHKLFWLWYVRCAVCDVIVIQIAHNKHIRSSWDNGHMEMRHTSVRIGDWIKVIDVQSIEALESTIMHWNWQINWRYILSQNKIEPNEHNYKIITAIIHPMLFTVYSNELMNWNSYHSIWNHQGRSHTHTHLIW